MNTCDAAHLQALSTRLPTISSRSCRSPRNFACGVGIDLDVDTAIAMDLLHGPAQRLDRGRDLGDSADDGEPRSDTRALQMVRDLIAHHIGLLQDLASRMDRRHARRLR